MERLADEGEMLVSLPSALERRRVGSVPIGFHVTMRLEDGRPIGKTIAELRVIVRVALAQGRLRGLLAFGTADNHLHALLAIDRPSAGAFALYLETGLQQRLRLGAPFEPARIRPLQDQNHANNTFWYVQRQDKRHDLRRDPFYEGTTLPDHLGARVIDTVLDERRGMFLPRTHREEVVERFPAGAFDERPLELGVLEDAACAALAIPNLHGRSPDVVSARRAVVHAVGPEVSDKVLGDCLDMRARVVRSLRALPPEPRIVRAVRMQALLRTPIAK